MNQDVKTKWLEALRSGEYEQTTGVLTRRNQDGTVGHCCLGVLCEIAVAEGIVERLEDDVNEGLTTAIGYTNDDGFPEIAILPEAVAKWAEISKFGDNTEEQVFLPSLNDNGTPFAKIADIIEKNF